jgi:hypothetical protein
MSNNLEERGMVFTANFISKVLIEYIRVNPSYLAPVYAFFFISGVGLLELRPLLAYCTSPG